MLLLIRSKCFELHKIIPPSPFLNPGFSKILKFDKITAIFTFIIIILLSTINSSNQLIVLLINHSRSDSKKNDPEMCTRIQELDRN